MISAANFRQAQIAIRAADSYLARGLAVQPDGFRLLLVGRVKNHHDLHAALEAMRLYGPPVEINTDQVTIAP